MKSKIIRLNEHQIEILLVLLKYEINNNNNKLNQLIKTDQKAYTTTLWYINELVKIKDKFKEQSIYYDD